MQLTDLNDVENCVNFGVGGSDFYVDTILQFFDTITFGHVSNLNGIEQLGRLMLSS